MKVGRWKFKEEGVVDGLRTKEMKRDKQEEDFPRLQPWRFNSIWSLIE